MIKYFAFPFACNDPSTGGSIFVTHVVFQILDLKFVREAAELISYLSIFSVSIEKRARWIRIA